jgi:hypothetical protein
MNLKEKKEKKLSPPQKISKSTLNLFLLDPPQSTAKLVNPPQKNGPKHALYTTVVF